MMAINIGNRSNESIRSVSKKQVTPFSIDDILSNPKTKEKEISCGNLFASLPSTADRNAKWRQFEYDYAQAMTQWNEEAYLTWLERLHSLCSVNTVQPFWISYLHPASAFSNSCLGILNPKKKQLKQNKKRQKLGLTSDEISNTVANKRAFPHSTTLFIPENELKRNELSDANLQEKQFLGSQGTLSGNCSTDSEESHLRERPESGQSDSDSPLTALEKLTNTTFRGMETKQHQLHKVASEREKNKTKRRKCRTAFTSVQLSILEQRFNCHKYLTPAERDQIAHILGLTAPQVITWFQNRRAKQKRELEEMKNDIQTVERSVRKCNVKSPTLGPTLARARRLDFQSNSNR